VVNMIVAHNYTLRPLHNDPFTGSGPMKGGVPVDWRKKLMWHAV
jgi:hypothetical protein